MTFNQPLDLETLLVGTLSGNLMIFTLLAMVVIIALAARFRMNNIAMFMMIGVFAVLMASWLSWLYAITIFIAGFGIFFIIAKIIKN